MFAVLCGLIAWGARRESGGMPLAEDGRAGAETNSQMLLWVALPACASALLLAITNHVTQNIAPIPFVWVLMLALYLLSFILCFESDRVYSRAVFLPLLAIVLAAMAFGLYFDYGNLSIRWSIPLYSGGLFICCMTCHGELSRLKPNPAHLTRYYLALALGGAIGGLFVAVAAPHVFHSYLELPLSLIACAALTVAAVWPQLPRLPLRAAAVLFVAALAGFLAYHQVVDGRKYVASVRNFYGLLRVTDLPEDNENTAMRKLVNGTIIHGVQIADQIRRREPTSYYGPKSGIGRAMALVQQRSHVRVGVVGLGAGVLAAYCRSGDVFRFYEINPLDVAVAKQYFTFLKDCPGSCDIAPGDARLTLEAQPPQNFDVIAVDAFSSDAIPVHLLTREAFGVYLRHLKTDGILAVHVSNRYLDLAPIVARDAAEFRDFAYEITDDDEQDYLSNSTWMLVGRDTHSFVLLGFQGAPVIRRGAPRALRTWTDDYSNLYQILKW
jgi:hypothetical protein